MRNFYNYLSVKFAARSQAATRPLSLFVLMVLFASMQSVRLFAQAPAISYASPQNYTAGTTITSLTPANNGGAVAAPGYSGTAVNIGSGFSGCAGVAVNAAGNVYVADANNNSVKEVAPGGSPVSIGTGFSNPLNVAVDAAGNVYVADNYSNAIKEIPAGGGSTITIATGFGNPKSVAIDAAGNIYFADSGNGSVNKIPAGTLGVAALATNLGLNTGNLSYGLAADAAGNVYFTAVVNGVNGIWKIPAGGSGSVTAVGSGFTNPKGLAIDGAGNLYITDGGFIKKMPPGGGTAVNVASGLTNPYGLAVDAMGNIYVADPTNSTIQEFMPTGGYYISPSIPTGLSFATNTGVLSGKPTTAKSTTAYTITAYNATGNGAASLSITVAAAVGPGSAVVNYTGPNTYTQGKAITALSPTGSGVAAPTYSSSMVPFGSGFSNPRGIAVDASGNLYLLDKGSNTLKKISMASGATTVVATGLANPYGVAIDAAGNIYVADAPAGNNTSIIKYPAGGGAPANVGSGFNGTLAVAVNAAGDVYVADGAGNVSKVPAGGGPQVVLSTQTLLLGLAVDAAGNLYGAGSVNSTNGVWKLPVGSGTFVSVGSGFINPDGIAIDGAGELFIADAGNGTVKLMHAGGSILTVASGFSDPYGLATDAAGNVFVTDYNNNLVREIKPVGGYFVSPLIPAGLGFSNSSGAFSGTPTLTSSATNYTVTGYNSAGSGSATVNISVVPPVLRLQSLSLSSGTLSPAFSAITTSYTANVSNATSSVTITPTAGDPSFTITVNGAAVASGSNSAAIPLIVGSNPITVIVSTQDGSSHKTYTVAVTRAASNDDNLSALKLNGGTFSPAFVKTTTSYTAAVANGVTSVKITPTVDEPNATVHVDGGLVTSGTASPTINLPVGATTINTIVTAQDGTTSKDYTIVVTRAKSSNTYLANLKISTGTLSPTFAYLTTGYTTSVSNATTSLTVTPVVADTTAKVKVNGVAVASKAASGPITLNVGQNTISVLVTAQDGVTTETYTITATRAPSADATLSDLHLGGGTLAPSFASATTNYTATVPLATTSVMVKPTANEPNATIKVNGTAVASGSPSGDITLNTGANNITTVVTAQDGTTMDTYTITVYRGATNDWLQNLKISSGTLSPAFAYLTNNYTASVANTTASITVTPVLADVNATVTVNGTAVASKAASGPIALSVGDNTITATVTAQNGISTNTYTIIVTRSGDGNIPDVAFNPNSTGVGTDGIAVHQGISPNGDGMNDFLVIEGINNYPDNKLQIMNREGTLVYEAKGYDNSSKAFDGHSNKNGAMQLPGTYFYSLAYTVKGITRRKTGFIVLKY